MNKTTKTVLIVALSLFGAGIIICLCVSMMIGFDYSLLSTNLNPTASEHIYKTFEASYQDIIIYTSYADVTVSPSTDGKIHLSYDNTDSTYFELDSSKSSIQVTQRQHNIVEIFGFTTNCIVELSIPEGYSGKLEVSSASGDIDLTDVDAADGIELGSTSGKVRAAGCMSGELDADTTSGSIELSASETGSIEASSVSGSISVSDMKNELSLDLSSSAGSVSAKNISASELDASTISGRITLEFVKGQRAELSTTSGSVHLNSFDYLELSFESVSGGISGIISGSPDDYSVFVDTISGSNSLSGHRGRGSRTLDLSTTSGSIDVSFEAADGKSVAKKPR